MELQQTSDEIWQQKYQLKDNSQNPVDHSIGDTFRRVSAALADFEDNPQYWEQEFYKALKNGATPAGRILANAGADDYKSSASNINCTVSQKVEDTMEGIMDSAKNSALTLAGGAGIGYEFSTLRPKGAFVKGAGAFTSGPLSFMDIFDSTCFTVSSSGGRRGAQMGTFAIWHPDVYDYIKAKQEDGRLRQFNLSLLIDDEFMEAVKNNDKYPLRFPVRQVEIDNGYAYKDSLIERDNPWDYEYTDRMDYLRGDNGLLFNVYQWVDANDLWETIMSSTYDYSEPGFILVDRINKENNNYFCENIRATNPLAN